MSTKIQNWLLIGIPKNWETALSQPLPIWGLKSRYQAEFEAMNSGDILWFYSTNPVSGVIGLGMIKDKYIDSVNLIWDEELKQKEVIWPLRFRIHVLKVLPQSRWKADTIKIKDFQLFWQVSLQPLRDDLIQELFQRAKGVFSGINYENLFAGATIEQQLFVREKAPSCMPTSQDKLTFSHRDLQNKIAEIGKLQFYHTELEYPIDLPGEGKNLDVVWKREIAGAPTFVFEVELSGAVEKAMARLKFSFNRWNSRPRIVVPKEDFKKVNNIVPAEEKDFQSQFRMYEPSQISELINRKYELKTVEQNLGLY